MWWTITILSTVCLFCSFIKVVGLREDDCCLLCLVQMPFFEGRCAPWKPLHTQRMQDRKKGICENAVSREMEHTRVCLWEALGNTMKHVCMWLGFWQGVKRLSRAFKETVWSLLQHRKLLRCWSHVKPGGRAHLQESSGWGRSTQEPFWLFWGNTIMKNHPQNSGLTWGLIKLFQLN